MLFHFRLFVFAVITLTLSSQTVSAHQETLNIATGQQWRPYIYIDEHGALTGSDVVLLKQLLKPLGMTLNAVRAPEQRLLTMAQMEQLDVAVGAAWNEERTEHFYYSLPYRDESIGYSYLSQFEVRFRGKALLQMLENNVLIGLNNAGWYGEWFEYTVRPQYQSQLVHAEGSERRLKMLQLERVDIVIDDINVLKAHKAHLGIDNLIVSNNVLEVQPVHFIFSKNKVTPAFMKKFNAVLNAYLTSNRD